MHIVEWQVRVPERQEPGWIRRRRFRASFRQPGGLLRRSCALVLDLRYRICEIGLRTVIFETAALTLKACKALLQGDLNGHLQVRLKRRADGVDALGERLDAGEVLRLAADIVDAVEASVPPWRIGVDERGRGCERLAHLLRLDHAVLDHPLQHIVLAVARTLRIAVRVEIAGP